MASLNDILKNGLPEVLDNVGGLADEVKGIATAVVDVKKTIKGADDKPEKAPPVNTQVNAQDIQGPNLSAQSTNRTLLIAGGVAVGLVALALIVRR